MNRIYRHIIRGHATNFFRCERCMDNENQPQMTWESRYVEVVGPGEGNEGVWTEVDNNDPALDSCGLCHMTPAQLSDEYDNWAASLYQKEK